MKISIIIPVYNEEHTVRELLARVKKAPLKKNSLSSMMAQMTYREGAQGRPKDCGGTNTPRLYSERKKLTWRDGMQALRTLIKVRFSKS